MAFSSNGTHGKIKEPFGSTEYLSKRQQRYLPMTILCLSQMRSIQIQMKKDGMLSDIVQNREYGLYVIAIRMMKESE